MGKRRENEVTRERLEEIIAARKDARYRTAVWSKAIDLVSGHLLAATLNFSVHCLDLTLVVRAEWKGAHEQQVFLQFRPIDGSRIARLCYSKCHDSPHWHYFEQFAGIDDVRPAVDRLPDPSPDVMDALLGCFCQHLHIENFVLAEELFTP